MKCLNSANNIIVMFAQIKYTLENYKIIINYIRSISTVLVHTKHII